MMIHHRTMVVRGRKSILFRFWFEEGEHETWSIIDDGNICICWIYNGNCVLVQKVGMDTQSISDDPAPCIWKLLGKSMACANNSNTWLSFLLEALAGRYVVDEKLGYFFPTFHIRFEIPCCSFYCEAMLGSIPNGQRHSISTTTWVEFDYGERDMRYPKGSNSQSRNPYVHHVFFNNRIL